MRKSGFGKNISKSGCFVKVLLVTGRHPSLSFEWGFYKSFIEIIVKFNLLTPLHALLPVLIIFLIQDIKKIRITKQTIITENSNFSTISSGRNLDGFIENYSVFCGNFAADGARTETFALSCVFKLLWMPASAGMTEFNELVKFQQIQL